jgi:ornithine carbamoyltransferase
MKLKHYLSVTDLSVDETLKIFNLALRLKKQLKKTGKNKEILKNKTLAMIFEKPSLRTRLSFEIGMTQLGGHALYLGPLDIQMGKRESITDVSAVTSRMADIIMARTFAHQTLIDFAVASQVPVINGLSELEHPCQALADFLTILEHKKKIKKLTLCFLGDGKNNVTHSLALMSAMMGANFTCASPKDYQMNKEIFFQAKKLAQKTGAKIMATADPKKAAKNVDVVITDTWISMGNEKEAKKRLKIFPPYQVNQKIMSLAKKNAIFMHCLPAHRNKEVTDEVLDGSQSVVLDEAENRLHAQKALLVYLATR